MECVWQALISRVADRTPGCAIQRYAPGRGFKEYAAIHQITVRQDFESKCRCSCWARCSARIRPVQSLPLRLEGLVQCDQVGPKINPLHIRKTDDTYQGKSRSPGSIRFVFYDLAMLRNSGVESEERLYALFYANGCLPLHGSESHGYDCRPII